MSVKVDAASATINLVTGSARPSVFIGPNNVTCHLTRGFNPGSPDGVIDYAIEATGRVKVTLGPKDTLSGWQFGFIQFARANSVNFYYAGKTRNEGGIAIQAHLPPALAEQVMLDSETEFSPWTRPRPQFSFASSEVNSKTGDHPAARAGRELKNNRTNATNYLFHIVDNREFWSIFSAIEPLGAIQYLAHFHWHLRYDIIFSWTGGSPAVKRQASSFKVGPVIKGAPKEPALQSFLTHPVAQFSFNSMIKKSIYQSILNSLAPNRTDNPAWFHNVPDDFFK